MMASTVFDEHVNAPDVFLHTVSEHLDTFTDL